MKDYSVLDNLGCRMLDLKPYLKKAYDEGYAQGLNEENDKMTNWEKWFRKHYRIETIQDRHKMICRHYYDCSDCPLWQISDDNCDYTNPKIKEWLESEANINE